MRKHRQVLKDQVSDIICDICGNSCLSECSMGDPAMSEYATLEGVWGYCSRRDGERFVCEMCEDCFERVSGFIDSIRRTPGTS